MLTSQSDSALIDAVRRRSVDDAEAALRDGADPNARDPQSTLSALMLAAGLGSVEIVRLLLRSDCYINALDSRAGASALHKACQRGRIEVVKALVEAGAFVDLQATTTGHTPLVEAIWFGSEEIVAYLLGKNARTELKTYYGFSLDQHIEYQLNVIKGASRSGVLQIRELVAQRRAADARKAAAALNEAVLDNNLEEVRKLIAAGADLEERFPVVGSFSDGHTPLLIAARDGREQIVAELIQAGSDVNAIEPVFGAVPLHKATYHGYLKITQLLCNAKGIDLNYQGPSNGYTPLHDALWHGYADCAEVLVSSGARTDIVAYDGKLPVDIAVEQLSQSHPIVAQLQNH